MIVQGSHQTREMPRVVIVEAKIQKYDWGATEGLLVNLYPGVEGQTVAEAWFGTYDNPKLVADLIREYGLSDEQIAAIPLAKLLQAGVERPLSIQVHPEESLARELHSENPSYYPDDRGKYEGSIALEGYSLLYNVADFSNLEPLFEEDGPLRPLFHLLSEELREKYQALKGAALNAAERGRWPIDAYCYLLTETKVEARASAVDEILSATSLVADKSDENFARLLQISRGFQELFSSSDPGVVAPLLMNIVDLEPGETIDIVPGTPHAYLPGACMIEVMVPSNNVCRVGATTKQTDPGGLRRCMKGIVSGLGNLIRGVPDNQGRSEINNYYFSVSSYSSDASGTVSHQSGVLPALVMVVRGTVTVGSEMISAGQGGYLPPNVNSEMTHSENAIFSIVEGKVSQA